MELKVSTWSNGLGTAKKGRQVVNRLILLLVCSLVVAQLSGCAFARIRSKRNAIEAAYATGQISAGEYFALDQALDEEGHRLRMFMAGGIAASARQFSANAAQRNFQFQQPAPFAPQMAPNPTTHVTYSNPAAPNTVRRDTTEYLVIPDKIGGKIEDGAIIRPR